LFLEFDWLGYGVLQVSKLISFMKTMGELTTTATSTEDSKKLREEFENVTRLQENPLQLNDTWYYMFYFRF